MSDLLADLLNRYSAGDLVWYRGQARSNWRLEPSLARKGGLDIERELLDEFRRDAIPLLRRVELDGGPPSDWDWMFLMQHYRVPTRLMDWTESPLVGLFFALDDTEVTESPGSAAVWAMRPQEVNRNARVIPRQPWSVPLCDHDDDAEMYTLKELERGNRNLAPLAVAATRRFDRIRAQGGVFTVIHKDATPLEQVVPDAFVRYLIPDSAKDKVRDELRRLAVTTVSVFPDLEHLGRKVAERLA